MNETIIRYRDRTIQYWNELTRKQRWIIASIGALTLLTIILVVYNSSRTEYSTAFKNLSADDAAAITEYLQSAGIKYRLNIDGKSIGVPTTKVAEVKIGVESQGLLKSGSLGYGIFRENVSSFGMTNNEFNVLNVDALAGEIEQLLLSYNGVDAAKVVVTLPVESAFLSTQEKEKASAVAVISFRPGYRPDQAQIDTIYNIVVHSVPNLPIENVAISDQNNELLPSSKLNGGEGSSSDSIDQQFLIKQRYELDIRKNVKSFLTPIFGADRVEVVVMANLNFDKMKTEENLVTPVNVEDSEGIPISRQESSKSTSSQGGTVGGTPGTGESDVPGYPSTDNTGSSSSDESSSITNWEVNRITNSIIKSPYYVKDLTIFAAIEPKSDSDPDPQTIAQVQTALASVVGTALADSGQTLTADEIANRVTLITRPFDGKSIEAQKGTNNLMLYGIGAAILLIGALAGYVLFRRKTAPIPILEEGLEEEEKQPEFQSIDIDNLNDNQVKRQLEDLAIRKPEEFVNLLRTWLVDE